MQPFTPEIKQQKLMQKQLFLSDIESGVSAECEKILKNKIKKIDTWLRNYENNEGNFEGLYSFLSEKKEMTRVTRHTYFEPNKALIYSPPQVGKTQACLKTIKNCISKGISVVISCDNKIDQMEQFVKRLKDDVVENSEAYSNCVLTGIRGKKFNNLDKSLASNKTFIIFMLDNKSQIQTLNKKMNTLCDKKLLKSLVIIHDEGDVVTKAHNVIRVETAQPESHQKWIEFIKDLTLKSVHVNRLFVTATPENVIYLHKPGHSLFLPIPENYKGSEHFNFHEVNDFSHERIMSVIETESSELKSLPQGGIILYSVERNKDMANQLKVFKDIKNKIMQTKLDAISVYNSDGIKVFFRKRVDMEAFITKIGNMERVKFSMENNIITVGKKCIQISEFYGIVQSIGCKVILTIGKDLISRGISFVSDARENPLTAATLIYKPGQTLNSVACCQAIGRLYGTAQPELRRKLYTTCEVYNNNKNFIENQKQLIAKIQENNLITNQEVCDTALKRLTRKVDRPKVEIEKLIKFREHTEENDSGYDEEQEETQDEVIDGVKTENLRRWVAGDTLVGRMINFLHGKQSRISFNEFKQGMGYTGSDEEFASNINNGSSKKAIYGKLWEYRANKIILNHKIRSFIDEKLVSNGEGPSRV